MHEANDPEGLVRSPVAIPPAPQQLTSSRRTLSQKQKINYLDAVKCLMHTPGKKTGIVSRFEDFLTEHQEKTAMVHFNAVFLPWHRLLLYEMERVLRSECGYRGAIPYVPRLFPAP